MRLADLNLLIYAVNRDAPHHESARQWLSAALDGEETLGLSWSVVLGFLRLTTNPRIFDRPLSADHALTIIGEWIDHPNVELVLPGEQHWEILRTLLRESGTAGNLTSDAHLAALAIERGAELESADADFARFRGLRWSNPVLAFGLGA